MAYKEETETKKPDKIIYPISEIERMDNEIRTKYEDFKTVESYDKFYVDMGVMKKRKNECFVINTTDYTELGNKLEQWHYWRARKDFRESKKIDGLEKVAESIKIKDDFVPDDW